jgi:hypothetical protein
VSAALETLATIFEPYHIWIRTSSSGKGLHILIAILEYDAHRGTSMLLPIPISQEEQNTLREQFADEPWNLECKGRFISDSIRKKSGYRTGRTFAVKNSEISAEWQNYHEIMSDALPDFPVFMEEE